MTAQATGAKEAASPSEPQSVDSVARPGLAAWKRKMWTSALVLMPLGLALVIVGAAQGWGDDPMRGFLIGSVGTFLIVLGALFGKFAVAGPYPEALR